MPAELPKFWMVTNRNKENRGFGIIHSPLTYWTSSGGPLDSLSSWSEVKHDAFARLLKKAADSFPLILDLERHEEQRHVAFFIHGYSTTWKEAVTTYSTVCKELFDGPNSLGVCVLFNWPTDGLVTNYLPDRMDARLSAPDLASVLSELYVHLVERQKAGAADPKKSCRAKVSLLAHSMGNFVVQKAAEQLWTRHNQPLLVSLINQLAMVAADVDNDLFKGGETLDKSEGDALANLTYRISALYSGRDRVLGLSAGLKHFGKRRLGRAGLDQRSGISDNVWDLDCSKLFDPQDFSVHNSYFRPDKGKRIYEVLRLILQGVDRNLIIRHARQIEFP